MPKQSPIIKLKRIAEQAIEGIEEIDIPSEVIQLRAFYEGVIACSETKGNNYLSKNPYTIGSQHFISWQTGWDYTIPIVKQKEQQRKETFKFLKEAV